MTLKAHRGRCSRCGHDHSADRLAVSSAPLAAPPLPTGVPGLGRVTNEGERRITLEFASEAEADAFMADAAYAHSVELDAVPPLTARTEATALANGLAEALRLAQDALAQVHTIKAGGMAALHHQAVRAVYVALEGLADEAEASDRGSAPPLTPTVGAARHGKVLTRAEVAAACQWESISGRAAFSQGVRFAEQAHGYIPLPAPQKTQKDPMP